MSLWFFPRDMDYFEDNRSGSRLPSASSRTAGSRRSRLSGVATSLATLLTLAGQSLADEPRRASEPGVLRESAEVTSVVDAFDGQDLFDAHITLGFQQSYKTALITRETHSTESGLSSGGYTASTLNVAEYTERTSRLHTRLDLGVYQDLAIVLRMPIILSNTRRLEEVDGSAQQQNAILQGMPGERLFGIPFVSPERSGIEYLAVGIDTNILNQWRDPTKPTWRLGIEGRFNVSEPLRACNANPTPGQVQCADPSDINRNGTPDSPYEGERFSGSRNPGVSRGTTGLAFHTYMSKRVKYVEPYAGLEGLFEFQNQNSDFGNTDLQGALVNHPPFQGTLVMGTAIMPWEALERFQRLEIDLRFAGTYRSEGRDYSELFDALGSSDAASMREPKFSEYQAGTDPAAPSVVNENSRRVYMTGITDVQPHGIYTLSSGVTWHTGEYFKLNAGTSLTFVQGHLFTFDQPCNPNFTAEPERSGPCRVVSADPSNQGQVTGIPNANYREVINVPGRRFKVDSATTWDLWINATLMF